MVKLIDRSGWGGGVGDEVKMTKKSNRRSTSKKKKQRKIKPERMRKAIRGAISKMI